MSRRSAVLLLLAVLASAVLLAPAAAARRRNATSSSSSSSSSPSSSSPAFTSSPVSSSSSSSSQQPKQQQQQKAQQRAAQSKQSLGHCVRVVKEFPHDSSSFTQGLVYLDGKLLEGTGLHGRSTLREVELSTGRTVKRVKLHERFFGEGVAVLGDKIFQLTWQQRVVLVYDLKTFDKVREIPYPEGPVEGWGLTSDGRRLYMSDGTSTLFVLDDRFRVHSRLEVRDSDGSPVHGLNELEWVDGAILANKYRTQCIVKISPATGRVEQWIVADNLNSGNPSSDVMNGIAYDPAQQRLFVTGKHWSRLYQVTIESKATCPTDMCGRHRA